MCELTTFGISVFIIIGPAQNGSRSPIPARALGTKSCFGATFGDAAD
jgi:predicted Abi (CAAX) family protease